MLSAPAIIPCTSVMTLRPGSAAPAPRGSSHTDSFTVSSIPRGSARVAAISNPASLTEPLLGELHPHRIQTRRPHGNVRTVMHHTGDLITRPPHAPYD